MGSGAKVLELPTAYTAYLVRMWQEGANGTWRASAQSVQTGQKYVFADLDALFAFLESQTLAQPKYDAHE